MTHYTENLCQNPSFQNGSAGYSAILGATLKLDSSRKLFGAAKSLLIKTPGSHTGEGVITAGGLITTAETCSVSLFIQGTGSVNVSANVNPGAVVAGTVPVMLAANQWQRVVLNNIVCTPGQTLYLTVYTSSLQATSFWISGIQVEADPVAHQYCDGDQPGCIWLSGPPGISAQPYQFSVNAIGASFASGNVVTIVNPNQFFITATGSTTDYSAVTQVTTGNPVAAFDDFAIFESTDPDPAQTYVGVNNALSNSGTSGAYNRIFSTFYAPLDYIVSAGQKLWSRAVYAAVGFQFASVPSSGTQNIADIQAEILPTSASAPSAYQVPRQINTIVIPNRLNFCTNPSIDTSTAGWSALGTASLARDATVFLPNVTIIDDVQTSSLSSLKVTLNAANDGAQISVSNLIVGNTYTASAYVQAGAGLANIQIVCGTGEGFAASTGSGLGYGQGAYGSPSYGGVVQTGTDLTTSIWYRPSFSFTATASTMTFSVLFTPGSDIAYPATMWVDAVLIEVGETLGDYFDGNFGKNYFWEGTANLSRSFYYDQFAVKSQAVSNVLSRHIPLVITFSPPQFKIPYTQI